MTEVSFQTVTSQEEGQRLDNYLIRRLKGVPRSHIYQIIRAGEVRVNKKRAKPSAHLAINDLIRIPPVRTASTKTLALKEPLAARLKNAILYEDSHLIVLNKPAGMAVHGGSGLSLGVIEAMRQLRADLSYLELVHRLDKDTSGCLLLAKKRSMLRSLHALLESKMIEKSYWAFLSKPWLGKKKEVVDLPLKKNLCQGGERRVVVAQEGKAAQTVFKLIENFKTACLVEALPKTGRTHQIRVHSAALDHPIVGDKKYTKTKDESEKMPSRLYLHAKALTFKVEGKEHYFEAPLDQAFLDLREILRRENQKDERP